LQEYPLDEVSKTARGSIAVIAKALAQVSNEYDLILIDCAPTEAVLLTDAAYNASRYLIVPIKPEFMAAIGVTTLGPLPAGNPPGKRRPRDRNRRPRLSSLGIGLTPQPTQRTRNPATRGATAFRA